MWHFLRKHNFRIEVQDFYAFKLNWREKTTAFWNYMKFVEKFEFSVKIFSVEHKLMMIFLRNKSSFWALFQVCIVTINHSQDRKINSYLKECFWWNFLKNVLIRSKIIWEKSGKNFVWNSVNHYFLKVAVGVARYGRLNISHETCLFYNCPMQSVLDNWPMLRSCEIKKTRFACIKLKKNAVNWCEGHNGNRIWIVWVTVVRWWIAQNVDYANNVERQPLNVQHAVVNKFISSMGFIQIVKCFEKYARSYKNMS